MDAQSIQKFNYCNNINVFKKRKKMKTKILIEVIKCVQPSISSDPCYFIETVSKDGKDFRQLGEINYVTVSQYKLESLAFYVTQQIKNISGAGFLMQYEISFPQEITLNANCANNFSIISGLTVKEIQNFFKALNNPKNPDPKTPFFPVLMSKLF